jgi:hypothetical protein
MIAASLTDYDLSLAPPSASANVSFMSSTSVFTVQYNRVPLALSAQFVQRAQASGGSLNLDPISHTFSISLYPSGRVRFDYERIFDPRPTPNWSLNDTGQPSSSFRFSLVN